MGILSGMLIVLGVKLLTGKKLSLPQNSIATKDPLQKNDLDVKKKPQTPVSTLDAIKQWIARILGRK